MRAERDIPEVGLLEKFRTCWANGHNKRVLILRFSRDGRPPEAWLPTLTKICEGDFRHDCEEIIIGHDNDTYIISRTMTTRIVQQFLSHLAQHLTPALETGLADLFEISVNWTFLREMCEAKIAAHARDALKQDHESIEIDFLPAAKSLDEISPSLIKSIPSRRSARRDPEIMIVEDDKFSQRLVSNVLSEKYKLNVSEDGEGAILSYVNKSPDVLFLDIGLPDMDGLEVLERIFALDPQAYVVMFSGNGNKENILKAVQLGAKGFVAKPFTQEKMFQYIERSPYIQAKRFAKHEEAGHGSTLH